MLNKYNQLLDMLRLNKNNYSISRFEEHSVGDVFHSSVITNNNNINTLMINIVLNTDNIEIQLLNEFDYEEFIEIKQYKNIKSAYNYIVKHLEE